MRKKWVSVALIMIISISLVLSGQVLAEDTSSDITDDYLKSVMDTIMDRYKGDITYEQLLQGAIRGMFSTMDNYTVYFDSDEAERFFGQMDGDYVGIGVMLSKEGEYVLITNVYAGSPAERAGIAAGDRIATVDGKNVVGASIEEVVSLVKGEAGTKVNLGIIKNGAFTPVEVQVYRGVIEINPVAYAIRGDIGYIKLEMFSAKASQGIQEALQEMDKQGIKRLILDLRNNPGGYVDQAVAIAKKFVPKGVITRLDFKSDLLQDETYQSDLSEIKYKLVVLVNEMSASASEIVSGAIQDTGAGTLVGTQTFGKGKVQSFIPMLTPEAYKKYKTMLGVPTVDAFELMTKYHLEVYTDEIMGWSKITTGEYFTPNGRMIDHIGLTPDVLVNNYSLDHEVDVNSIQKLSTKTRLTLKSENIDVLNAEKILLLSGYDVDTPDMKLDRKTTVAMKKFQMEEGVRFTPYCGFELQTALNKKLEKLRMRIDTQYAKAVDLLQEQK